MNVARIPYLNPAPFYADWDDPPFRVVDMVPRRLGRAAREGSIDGGLMAAADFFDLSGTFELVRPPMGIAASGHVRSVALFSSRAPTDLSGGRIGLTGESSTSRRLTRLMARAWWRLEGVEWVEEADIEGDPVESVDALLLIGDRALEAMADPGHQGWARPVDLATEWWAWQGLPFVFAVWAVRSAVPAGERERFAEFLAGSLAVGEGRIGEIARAHAGRLGDAATLAAYLENFTYRLGAPEIEGLERFRALLAEHGVTG